MTKILLLSIIVSSWWLNIGNAAAQTPTNPSFTIPAATGQLAQDFNATLIGQGTASVGQFNFVSNSGTLALNGQVLNAFIQKEIPWAAYGYTLFQGIAYDQNQLHVFWLYCNAAQKIENIYFEGVTDPLLRDEAAGGTCSFSSTPTSTLIQIPNLSLQNLPILAGVTIQSSVIELEDGKPGRLPTKGMNFIPFTTVDCSKCGSDGGAGWDEIHSFFYNDDQTRFCYGIIYLEPQAVTLNYSFCFDDFSGDLDLPVTPATWTYPTPPTP
jgi:hypothetical protein